MLSTQVPERVALVAPLTPLFLSCQVNENEHYIYRDAQTRRLVLGFENLAYARATVLPPRKYPCAILETQEKPFCVFFVQIAHTMHFTATTHETLAEIPKMDRRGEIQI